MSMSPIEIEVAMERIGIDLVDYYRREIEKQYSRLMDIIYSIDSLEKKRMVEAVNYVLRLYNDVLRKIHRLELIISALGTMGILDSERQTKIMKYLNDMIERMRDRLFIFIVKLIEIHD